MTSGVRQSPWLPSTTHLTAGGLVVAGLLLTGVSWWFLVVAAVGMFGPGILREIGCLQDLDEFEQRAAHRAGYHAFLTAGIVGFLVVAFVRGGEREIRDPSEMAVFLVAVLWFSWFLSSLITYWGPTKSASRILVGFGSVWLVFMLVSNIGSEWTGWTALFLQPLLALPFFGLAWAAKRWQRSVGALLLLTAGCLFTWLFLPGLVHGSAMGGFTQALTVLLFIGPLLASGIALLVAASPQGSDAEEDRALA